MKLEKATGGAPEPSAGDSLDYWMAYSLGGLPRDKPPRAVLSKAERRALLRAKEILDELHDILEDEDDDAEWWLATGSAGGHIGDLLLAHADDGYLAID